MSIEIERKFLLGPTLPIFVQATIPFIIKQGYLPGKEIEERVRKTFLPDSSFISYSRAIKAGQGISRIEVEEEIQRELFIGLWHLTEGRRVYKRRYKIRDAELVYEIDDYLDRDLRVVEVEVPSENYIIRWNPNISKYIVREVTNEPEFKNRNLAR